ncbi:hypothetical protein ACTXT7_004394 [Hymenolepis weldensis]
MAPKVALPPIRAKSIHRREVFNTTKADQRKSAVVLPTRSSQAKMCVQRSTQSTSDQYSCSVVLIDYNPKIPPIGLNLTIIATTSGLKKLESAD